MKTITILNLKNGVWFIDSSNNGYLTTDRKLVRNLALNELLCNRINSEYFNALELF